MTYVQGFLIPVPNDNKAAYLELAETSAAFFKSYGALQTVECWGRDVPDGAVTDFKRAVKAEDTESVVFSWIVWPSKEACDAAAEKMQQDAEFDPGEMPFDGKRMVMGGFDVILDTGV